MDQFDPNIPGNIPGEVFLQGDVNPVTVTAPAGFPSPALPNLVVDPSEDFTLTVNWEVYGDLTNLWFAAIDDVWSIDVHAESLGGGPETLIGSASVNKNTFVSAPVPGKSFRRLYTVDVNVPAGTLQEGNPGSNVSGIYKLVAGVFLNSGLGQPGFDMTGFREGPIIRAENPV